jgi:hypothetical protein
LNDVESGCVVDRLHRRQRRLVQLPDRRQCSVDLSLEFRTKFNFKNLKWRII